MTPELHPWLDTPDALDAAKNAVRIPMAMMGRNARAIGADELLSEALAILTECARPAVDRTPGTCARCGGSLDQVRAGAKFCSPRCRHIYAVWVQRGKAFALPPSTRGYVGSMWGWPEADRMRYAVREVGYALNNYVRTRPPEHPSSDYLAMYV